MGKRKVGSKQNAESGKRVAGRRKDCRPSVTSREQKIYGGGDAEGFPPPIFRALSAGNRCLLTAYCLPPTAYSHP